jgi:hypothetical protein
MKKKTKPTGTYKLKRKKLITYEINSVMKIITLNIQENN